MNAKQCFVFLTVILVSLIISCGPKPAGNTGGTNTGGTQSGDGTLSAGGTEGTSSQGYEDRPGTTVGSEGGVTRTTGEMPANWPKDIPIMEGFTVVNGQVSSNGMMSVLLFGSVPVDDVFKFYSALEGWQKDPNVPWIVEGPNRTIKLVRSLENLSINIYENQARTQLSLTYYLTPTGTSG